MTPDQILARETSFKDLLKTYHPQVPQLQRNYSWTANEWDDLWSDLTGFYDDAENDQRPYFIGTVVLQQNKSSTEILDGQQRVATLTILMEVLTRKLREYDQEAASIYESLGLRERISKGKYKPFIRLNQYDDPFFRSIVIDRKESVKAKYESHKLIGKAKAFFDKRADELFEENPELDKAEWLDQFSNMILEKVFFVFVRSHPADSHQVFRVLNDRGRGLSQLDLFRTFLLQKADEENRDEIATSWTQVLDIQSPGNPQDLLRFYWITKRGDVKSRRLFRDIEEQVKKKAITAEALAEELFFFSGIYQELTVPSVGGDPWRAHSLQTIADVKAKALYPILMKLMYSVEDGKASLAQFDKVLSLLVTLYIRHTIIGHLDNFRLENLTFSLAKQLGESVDADGVVLAIKKFASEQGLSDEWFYEKFCKASAPSDAVAKSLLRSLEGASYNKSELSIPVTSMLHLEHIYPKKPKEGDAFVDHDDWISRYGNLTLLDGKINRKATNSSFDKKIPEYAGSSIAMTKDLCALPHWNKDAIGRGRSS